MNFRDTGSPVDGTTVHLVRGLRGLARYSCFASGAVHGNWKKLLRHWVCAFCYGVAIAGGFASCKDFLVFSWS